MAKIIVEKDLQIPMRDGTVLSGDLYRPDSTEKLPVLLNRTPYNKALPQISLMTLDPLRAAMAGYNVLFQDCRGRFASQGVFRCFEDEAFDGYDTIEWAARQPWSNGAVANVFKAGHRIRLEVSSSNFPRFDRNPNTGHDLFADAETRRPCRPCSTTPAWPRT